MTVLALLFISGDRDLVMALPGMNEVVANLAQNVPLLRKHAAPARMRTLDPAGARAGSQHRDHRLSAVTESEPKSEHELNQGSVRALN